VRRYLQIAAALVVAILAGLFVHSLASPPPMVFVPFVAAPVAVGHRIAATDITWRDVVNPPPGALQAPSNPVGQRARHALLPGQALSANDLGGASPTALKPGEVMWMAPVGSAAASGLPAIGQRVDVWSGVNSNPNGVSAPVLLAVGARVVGLFSSTGLPLTSATANPSGGSFVSTSTGAAIGILGIAVPFRDLGTLLAGQGLTFVVDPFVHHFHLTATNVVPTPKVP
jgi:hypothetical protein